MNLSLVPFYVHETVQCIVDTFNLSTFDLDYYVFDDFYENLEYLKTLDSKVWKEQDHYAVLRLKNIRVNASQDLIKKAYRKQMLAHHPDKGQQRIKDNNNDYFVCITNAYDLLSNPATRISYDSFDPSFDDEIPSSKDVKQDFYNILYPVFERNSIWSKEQPVPQLGNDETNIDDVHEFYNFWEEFRSWREYTYSTEPDEETNRFERRCIKQERKSEMKELKADENRRIRTLVQLAKKHDPRIKRDNEMIKQKKEAEKKAREEKKLAKIREIEEAKKAEEEKIAKEEEDKKRVAEEQKKLNKKEKDAQKNKIRNERKKLKNFVKSKNSFEEVLKKEESTKSMQLRKAEIDNLVDYLCVKLSFEELVTINTGLESINDKEALDLLKKDEERYNKINENGVVNGTGSNVDSDPHASSSTNSSSNTNTIEKCGTEEWNFELQQLLIRAINTHPPGTKHRWSVVADFMNTHKPGLNVRDKQIIYRAKSLKSDDSQLRKEASNHSLKTKANVQLDQNNVDITNRSEAVTESLPWSLDEQKRLEEALKKIPSKDPERWEKISTEVGTRTKKECVLRFKTLAEKLKAKKVISANQNGGNGEVANQK